MCYSVKCKCAEISETLTRQLLTAAPAHWKTDQRHLNSPLPAPAKAFTTKTAIKTAAHTIITTILDKLLSLILAAFRCSCRVALFAPPLARCLLPSGRRDTTQTHVDQLMPSRAPCKRPQPWNSYERRDARFSPDAWHLGPLCIRTDLFLTG